MNPEKPPKISFLIPIRPGGKEEDDAADPIGYEMDNMGPIPEYFHNPDNNAMYAATCYFVVSISVPVLESRLLLLLDRK